MDFNYAESFENGVIVKDVRNFDLYQVFSCGQCFRWNREENGNFTGVAFERVIEAEKKGNDLYLYNTNQQDFIDIWADYFDLYRDYDEIKDNLKKDEILKKAVKYGDGIRILNQDPFETLISFIISSNNRIPMIKKVIENKDKPIFMSSSDIASPTYIEDLCSAIETMMNSNIYGIYNCVNSGPVKKSLWVKTILDHVKIKKEVLEIPESYVSNRAQRPKCTIMNTSLIKNCFDIELRSWEAALSQYLNK
jgi:hypothetical protein